MASYVKGACSAAANAAAGLLPEEKKIDVNPFKRKSGEDLVEDAQKISRLGPNDFLCWKINSNGTLKPGKFRSGYTGIGQGALRSINIRVNNSLITEGTSVSIYAIEWAREYVLRDISDRKNSGDLLYRDALIKAFNNLAALYAKLAESDSSKATKSFNFEIAAKMIEIPTLDPREAETRISDEREVSAPALLLGLGAMAIAELQQNAAQVFIAEHGPPGGEDSEGEAVYGEL